MVQSIELLFDEATEAAIRGTWQALADAGLPSLAGHQSDSNRPHVTLAAAEEGLDDADDAVRAVFTGWSLPQGGLAVTVGSVVLFGGHRQRWVLARPLVPTGALLRLHDAVHAAIERGAPAASVEALTRPGSWTPHVSLARRIPAADLATALGAVDPEPVHGHIVGARFWDSAPATVTALA